MLAVGASLESRTDTNKAKAGRVAGVVAGPDGPALGGCLTMDAVVLLDDISNSGLKTSAAEREEEEQGMMENGRQENKAAQKERNYFQMIEVRSSSGLRGGRALAWAWA